MGSVNSISELSSEEKTIVDMENQLEFGKNSTAEVDFTIRRYTFDREINSEQWKSIGNELQLKTRAYSHCPKVEEFYASYKNSQGNFSMKEILILGIVLSSGQIGTKARLFFDIYDELGEKIINKEAVEDLFDELIKCTLIKLPMLVSNSCNPPVGEKQIQRYASRLLQNMQRAKVEFVDIILEGQSIIELNEFKRRFDLMQNALLLTTFGFRNFVFLCKS